MLWQGDKLIKVSYLLTAINTFKSRTKYEEVSIPSGDGRSLPFSPRTGSQSGATM